MQDLRAAGVRRPGDQLCTEKRGTQTNMHYSARHVISYDLPLNEVVLDFFDRLKSATRGYGSLDYEFKEYRAADMVRLDILVNGERVDALSSMVHRSGAQHRGRELVNKLRSLIPARCSTSRSRRRSAAIIARENVKALRKNVLAKCYGGDVTRKRKGGEGGEEAHEAGGRGRDPAGGVPRGAAAGEG